MSSDASRAREEQEIQEIIKQYYRNRPGDFNKRSPGRRLPWEALPSKLELLHAPVSPAIVERIQRLLLAAYGRQLPQIDGHECLPDAVQVLTRVKIIAILRYQNQPDLFDRFLASDVWDDSLPISEEVVRNLIPLKQQARDFYKNQFRGTARNFDSFSEHTTFLEHEYAPLLSIRTLGRGSYGLVDEAENIYCKTRWARKLVLASGRIPRAQVHQELANLRKLGLHRHFVQLVGSYEIDTTHGLLFLPVADCNLYEYLKEPTAATYDDYVAFLLRCFGCLSSALKYMHDKGIRHKDVKPTNILVHGSTVLFTDFGLAYDYSDSSCTCSTSGVMSTGIPEALTKRYAAPEILDYDPRNNKSDVFSLGCVFLEIWAALTDNGLEGLEKYLKGSPDFPTPIIYASVASKATNWAKQAQELDQNRKLATPLEWCLQMMELDQKKRPNINLVCAGMTKTTYYHGTQSDYFCEHCLRERMPKAPGTRPSSEVPERCEHNFSGRKQADPLQSYRKLRQEAHDELENIYQRRLDEVPNPPLFDAIRHGETDEVRRLLVEEGVEAIAQCKGKSALHWAADSGFQDIAELLIERGADLNGRDSSGLTPLHWAAFENHPDLVEYFLGLGAEHDTVDQWGDSPLEDARGRYQTQVVALLEAADRKKTGRKLSVPETEGLLHRVASMAAPAPQSFRPRAVESTTSSELDSSNTTSSLSNNTGMTELSHYEILRAGLDPQLRPALSLAGLESDGIADLQQLEITPVAIAESSSKLPIRTTRLARSSTL